MSNPGSRSAIPQYLKPEGQLVPSGLDEQDLSFRQAIRVLRNRKTIILTTLIACLVAAFVVSIAVTPYYSTTGVIEIQKQQSDLGISAVGQLASSLGASDDAKTEIQTEVSVLQSSSLAVETMEREHFESHLQAGWRPFGKKGRPASEQGLPLVSAPATREGLLGQFIARLKVVPILDTRLIQVTFQDRDPNYAADVTNALIKQYVEDKLGRRNSSTIEATAYMSREIEDLDRQVQAAQQRLIDYERESGLIVLPSGPSSSSTPGSAAGGATVGSPIINRLMQLNIDLVTAKENTITRRATYLLAQSGNTDALANIAEAQMSPTVSTPAVGGQSGMFSGLVTLRGQQVALRLQIASNLQSYGPKNPHLVDIDNQLSEINREIGDEVGRIINRARLDYDMAKKAEEGIQEAYSEEEAAANKVNDSQIRLAVLQQEADSTRMLYQDLYTKLQESKLSVGTQASNVAIISNGLSSASPAFPRKVVNLAIGLGAGLFLGVIFAFVSDYLDDGVANADQAEEITGLPVVGLIPLFDRPTFGKGKRGSDSPEKQSQGMPPLPWVQSDPRSKAAEAYRGLRTALLLSKAEAPPRTILVTSSLPGEGKSTTTYNLGASFAALGTRVLIIDADFRKPTLHTRTRLKNESGLSTVLASSKDPDELILADPNVENLSLLLAGPIPPNPAELLSSQSFARLLTSLSEKYEVILVDSPPTLLVADATIISVLVERVIIVVLSHVTTRSALGRAVEQLRRSTSNLAGLVLNRVDLQSSEYYYAYGYYGGKYYGEDENGNQ